MMVSVSLGGFQRRSFRKSLVVKGAKRKTIVKLQGNVDKNAKHNNTGWNETHEMDREENESRCEEREGPSATEAKYDEKEKGSEVAITNRKTFQESYSTLNLISHKLDHDLHESVRRCDGEKVTVASYHLLSHDEGIPGFGIPLGAIRDIAFRKEAEHPNILQCLNVFVEPSKTIIVSGFAGITLLDVISTSCFSMDEALIRSLFLQLLLGVEFCHSRRVILTNIKTSNILVDSRMSPPLLMIGNLARATLAMNEPRSGIAMNPTFMSPELLLASKWSLSCMWSVGLEADMWSVGCILPEMMWGRPLFFMDNTEIGTLMKIFQQLGTPTESSWPEVSKLPNFSANFPKWKPQPWTCQDRIGVAGTSLLDMLLSLNPRDRISARRALKHAWFTTHNSISSDCAQEENDSRSAVATGIYKVRQIVGSCTAACSKRPFVRDADALALIEKFVGERYAPQYAEYLHDMDILARQTEVAPSIPREDFWQKKGTTFETGMRCRAILVDWMVDVCRFHKSKSSTLFLAVAYVDQYIAKKQMTPEKFQCLGAASIFIASKFEDDTQMEGSCLVSNCGGAFGLNDLQTMEIDVLNTINFNLNLPVVPYFLERFLGMNGSDEAHCYLAYYLAEMTLMNVKAFQYPPSQIAAAAIWLSNGLRKKAETWPPAMMLRTGYAENGTSAEASLERCAETLHMHVASMRKSSLQAINKKYAKTVEQALFEEK